MLAQEEIPLDGIDDLLNEMENDAPELSPQDLLERIVSLKQEMTKEISKIKSRYDEELDRLKSMVLGIQQKAKDEGQKRRFTEMEAERFANKQSKPPAKKQKKQGGQTALAEAFQSTIVRSGHRGLPPSHSEPRCKTEPVVKQEKTMLQQLQAVETKATSLQVAPSVKEVETEAFTHQPSKYRLRQQAPDTTHLEKSHKYLKLHELRQQDVKDGELSVEDWWTCGVMASKSEPKTAKNGNKYITTVLSDLRGNIVNLILFDKAYEEYWKKSVPSDVYAIISPKIPRTMDAQNTSFTLNISKSDQIMWLGQSVDFVKCRAYGQSGTPCGQHLDRREGELCGYHQTEMVRRGKLSRQELATGTAPLFVVSNNARGKDIAHQKQMAKREAPIKMGGSVLVDGQVIQIGPQSEKTKKLEPTDPQKAQEEIKKTLEKLANDNSLAARQMRAAFGITDQNGKDSKALAEAKQKVFGEHMKEMGFDPCRGFGDITTKSPSKSPPKKIVMDDMEELYIPELDGPKK